MGGRPAGAAGTLGDELAEILSLDTLRQWDTRTAPLSTRLRTQIPSTPAWAALCPQERTIDLEAVLGSGAATFARSSIAFNWNEADLAWQEIPADVPRFHGCRWVYNFLDTIDSADHVAGAGVAVHQQLEDLLDVRLGATTSSEADGFRFTGNTPRNNESVGLKFWLGSMEMRVSPLDGSTDSAGVNIRVKRHTGGASTTSNRTVAVTTTWQRFAGDVWAGGDAAMLGLRLILMPGDSSGTDRRIEVRRVLLEEISHRRVLNESLAHDDADQPSSEWPGYSPAGDGTDGVWRLDTLTNTIAEATGVVTESELHGPPGDLIHPTVFEDGVRKWAVFSAVERSTAYALGDFRVPDGLRPYNNGSGGAAYWQGGVYLECTTAGTSHASTTAASLMTFTADALGETITDGTVVWTVRGRYVHHGIPGLVKEHASTNVAGDGGDDTRDANTFNASGPPVIDTNVGIDGLTVDLSIEDDGAGLQERVDTFDTVGIETGTNYVGSWFLKKRQVSSDYPQMRLHTSGGGTQPAQGAFIDANTGAFNVTAENDGSVWIEDWGPWWRVIAALVTDESQTTITLDLRPAGSADGSSGSAAATGTAEFDFPMLEPELYPSSPIRNDTASTTRARDDLSYAAAWDDDLDADEIIACATVCALGASHSLSPRIMDLGGSGDLWYWNLAGSNFLIDIGTATRATGSPSANMHLEGITSGNAEVTGQHLPQKQGFYVSDAEDSFRVNSSLQAGSTETDPGTDDAFAGGALEVGNRAADGLRDWQGIIGNLVFYPAMLTGSSGFDTALAGLVATDTEYDARRVP